MESVFLIPATIRRLATPIMEYRSISDFRYRILAGVSLNLGSGSASYTENTDPIPVAPRGHFPRLALPQLQLIGA